MDIVMPQLNDAGDPGEVSEILVEVGDTVSKGDAVMSLEMEKAIVEVESEHDGTVKAIAVEVGDEVEVGQKLLELE
jgi:pyruvate/2-oxoglutarate dehydrogenase complex dihydrolipoamide acyltransferase (E2) component